MNAQLSMVFLFVSLACLVLAEQVAQEEGPSADKRMRSFAFAKRSPYRAFAFAKRSDDEDDSSEEEEVDKRSYRGFAFAKRSPYRAFAFAKRSPYRQFAFAKRGLSSFA